MFTRVNSTDEWVSWFVDGKAEHFPVESPTGQQILGKLIVEGFEPQRAVGERPKMKPRAATCLQCGRKMAGRKSKMYCNARCRSKHNRPTR